MTYPEETFYQIKNPAGNFSTGGCSPSFSKKGKRWKTIGHVNSHLSQLGQYSRQANVYDNCVLVTTTLTVTNVAEQSMGSIMENRRINLRIKEEQNRQAQQARAKAERRQLFNQLRSEFENE